MKESFEKGLVKAIEMNPEIEVPENTIPVINKDYLRFQHESQIFEFLDKNSDVYLVDRILNFKWMLIQAKNKNFYFISDNPIIFYNSFYEKQKSRGNDFIANMREKALSKLKNDEKAGEGMLLTSEHPERRPGVKGVEIYFPISPQFCVLLVDWQRGFKRLKTDKINEQIVLQANQYIYSHQNDFSKVKEVLKNHPEMKDKSGKRAIVQKILEEKKKEGEFKFKAINIRDLLEE